jgi:hypothetical protein
MNTPSQSTRIECRWVSTAEGLRLQWQLVPTEPQVETIVVEQQRIVVAFPREGIQAAA